MKPPVYQSLSLLLRAGPNPLCQGKFRRTERSWRQTLQVLRATLVDDLEAYPLVAWHSYGTSPILVRQIVHKWAIFQNSRTMWNYQRVISMDFEGPIMSTIQGVWKPIMRRHVDCGKAQVQADSPKHRWTHHQSTSRFASAAEKQTWRQETLMKLTRGRDSISYTPFEYMWVQHHNPDFGRSRIFSSSPTTTKVSKGHTVAKKKAPAWTRLRPKLLALRAKR